MFVSYINQFGFYNFCSLILNIVYFTNPQHLIGGFELFGDTFPFSIFFYKPKKEFLRFFLYISKVRIDFTGSKQVAVQYLMVLFQVPQPPLSHTPMGRSSLLGRMRFGRQ